LRQKFHFYIRSSLLYYLFWIRGHRP